MFTVCSKKNILMSAVFLLLLNPLHAVGGGGNGGQKSNNNAVLCAAGLAFCGITAYLFYNKNAEYYKTLESESVGNVPHYLKEAEFVLTGIECNDYMKAWTSGIDSQRSFSRSIESFQRSGQALSVLSDLGQLSNQLSGHSFKEYMYRATFLSNKYQMYQGECLALKNYTHRIKQSLNLMKEIVQNVYDTLDRQETLHRFYEDMYVKIKKLQTQDLFTININNVKVFAFDKYRSSPWYYILIIKDLDSLKNEADSLRNSIRSADFHEKQDSYLKIVSEFYDRALFAIDFITKDPEYSNQYYAKLKYDNEVNMQMSGHHMPGY